MPYDTTDGDDHNAHSEEQHDFIKANLFKKEADEADSVGQFNTQSISLHACNVDLLLTCMLYSIVQNLQGRKCLQILWFSLEHECFPQISKCFGLGDIVLMQT